LSFAASEGAGASAACARKARSIGRSGTSAAPVNILPSEASTLRREVCRASEREEFSNKLSNERMRDAFRD
jgi:hypothetical protein